MDGAEATTASLEGRSNAKPNYLWRNGSIVPWGDAVTHVNGIGHASVSAVFEGIKVYKGDSELFAFRLQDHIDRLRFSAKICRLSLEWDDKTIIAAIVDLIRVNGFEGDTYIRPWLFPQGIFREHITPAGIASELVIDSWPFESDLHRLVGRSAAVSSWIRPSNLSIPMRVKAFSNYHNSRLATMEVRESGYDWPIILNADGNLTESAGACLFFVKGNRLLTPDLASGVLEGITRDTVIDICSSLGIIDVVTGPFDRTELYSATEIFFAGTGWEIMPVTSVDRLKVGDGKIGSITKKVARLYDLIVRGRHSRSEEWCHVIGR